MKRGCSKSNQCNMKCDGCSYQHFDKIVRANRDNKYIRFLGEKHFKNCITKQKGRGGRIALDKPIKELFLKEISQLKELSSNELKVKLRIGKKEVDFMIKCDGAFESNGNYIFYEVKGYGNGTNDILSAIIAAQMVKEIKEYKKSHYFYIGIVTSKTENGLQRKHLFDKKRIKLSPYVKWAEKNKIMKFYGIVEIGQLLEDVKSIIN